MIATQITNINSLSIDNFKLDYRPTYSNDKPAHQDGTTYHCNGFVLPLDLVKAAHKLHLMLSKKGKAGLAAVFEQISYICLTQESRLCFKKQSSLGIGCGQVGKKQLSKRQVRRHEDVLVDLGLYKRERHPNRRLSYDRALSPLGTVVYLLRSKKIYFFEKVSPRNEKNVPSQILRHKRKIFINTSGSSSKRDSSDSKQNKGFQLIKENQITNINNKYNFDIELKGQRKRNVETAKRELKKMREQNCLAEPKTSEDKSYLQDVFRRQAKKQIDNTKRKLAGNDDDSFEAIQKRATDRTKQKMKQYGYLDNKGLVPFGKEEDAKRFLDICFEAQLNREKKNSINHIADMFVSNASSKR